MSTVAALTRMYAYHEVFPRLSHDTGSGWMGGVDLLPRNLVFSASAWAHLQTYIAGDQFWGALDHPTNSTGDIASILDTTLGYQRLSGMSI